MSLLRAYVNFESVEMYRRLFHASFKAIEDLTGQETCWQHIHQSGWNCIVMDMDTKQMSGMIHYINILRTYY